MFNRFIHIFIILFITCYSSFSQVINKGTLEMNHEGTIENSINNADGALSHEWIFQSIHGVKSMYKLKLTSGEKSKEYDVRIRNLITTMYIAVRLTDSEGKVTTLTSIYDKGDKWQRVKMAASKECLRRDAKWARYNQIMSLDELLNNIISQIDTNLVLGCYM
jgi:hypothetical protein